MQLDGKHQTYHVGVKFSNAYCNPNRQYLNPSNCHTSRSPHVYPLRFEPIFKDYLWGGRRLAEKLGKLTGAGQWAESWELVDHVHGQSQVRDGHWAGRTLRDLLEEQGPEIVGTSAHEQLVSDAVPPQLRGRFPLLLKFLDASQRLSVQVHPDDVGGAALDPPDLGKTEAWYVVDAEPGSQIYAGLKEGVTRADFELAVKQGTTESVLHCFQPKPGDCIFVKAGTVHAIGEGLLVCEIQQASDTTFRLFDWNRVGADGNSRPLHIEQGLDAIDFQLGPVSACTPRQVSPGVENLVECEKFILNRWQLEQPRSLGGDGRFHILAVVSGSIAVESDPCRQPMETGQSMLIPANCPAVSVTPSEKSVVLEIHLP